MDTKAAANGTRPLMTPEELNVFLARAFPQLNEGRNDYSVVEVHEGGCTVRLDATDRHLRPGGTVSGPALFTLADIGGYVCALSHIGPVALAVTINLNINFMRKAQTGTVEAECRILKLGRSLMVFDCDMVAGPDRETVAHATGTYSIPPRQD